MNSNITSFIFRNNWLIVMFLFLIVELYIQPIGEFPLNDDWAYSQAIYSFIYQGKVQLSNMIAIPFLSQYLVGIGVAKLFGFSFFVLRCISIVYTFLMIFIVNRILLLLKIKSDFTRFSVLLLFCFNPLVLSLANTFLPDSGILLLALIAVYFMIKIVNEYSRIDYFWFVVFTVLGTLTRQSNIIIPLIFAFVYYYSNLGVGYSVKKAFFPFFVNLIALLLFENITRFYGLLPLNFNLQVYTIARSVQYPSLVFLKNLFVGVLTSTICIGIFITPLLISNFKNHFSEFKNSRICQLVVLLYLVYILFKISVGNHFEPSLGNMLYSFGIGPIIMTGFESTDFHAYLFAAKIILTIISALGAFSFVLAFYSIFKNVSLQRDSIYNWFSLFVCLMLIFYLIPISLNYANDRYLLFLIPFFIIGYTLVNTTPIKKILFLIPFLLISIYSIIGVDEYFEFNKTRWKALNYLTKELNISPEKIDGGFEFNAWYFSNSTKYNAQHAGRWWWIEDDEFIISPKPRKGYSEFKKYKMNSIVMLPFDELKILKRDKISIK
jgi:hypothetical protein